MQTSTIVVLLCLIAAVAARAQLEPAAVNAQESHPANPTPERSPRNKRDLLLLKKKLILGALGLTAAKIGAVGAAGVAGALALKAKSAHKVVAHKSFFHHGLNYNHESETETERW